MGSSTASVITVPTTGILLHNFVPIFNAFEPYFAIGFQSFEAAFVTVFHKEGLEAAFVNLLTARLAKPFPPTTDFATDFTPDQIEPELFCTALAAEPPPDFVTA